MGKDKNTSTIYDKDYEGDSWLGKKEISFSSKLIVAIGGITSFGGLFPTVVDQLAHLIGDDDLGHVFFLFSLSFFVLPLIVFIIWVWLTDRVVYPRKDWKIGNWNRKEFINYPITYRYKWFLWLHIILIASYLLISILFLKEDHDLLLFWLTLFLFITPILAWYTFSKRNYANRKFTKTKLGSLLLTTLIAIGIYVYYASSHQHEGSAGYQNLIAVDNIADELDELEKNISNRVERFYIKSLAQVEVTLDTEQSLDPSLDVSALYIDPFVKALGQIMLKEKITSTRKPELLSDSLAGNTLSSKILIGHKSHLVDGKNSLPKAQHSLFLPSDSLFDQYEDYRLKDSNSPKSDTIINQANSLNLSTMMNIVDGLINHLIDRNQHRVYPECIQIDSSNKRILDSLNVDANDLATLLNYRNSVMLKEWVENIYIPYCQRKAQTDIEEIATNTQWVWQDMQIRGVAISLISLILLALFYIELIDLKAERIHSIKALESESQEIAVEEINQKADYLLFPLTMTLTIVAMLLIPITSQKELSGITPTKTFWKMNVPSLHLPEAVEDVISSGNTDKKEQDIPTEMLLQLNEMERLIISLDCLKTTIDSGIEVKLKDHKHFKLQDSIQSNKDSINKYKARVIELEKELEKLNKSLPGR